MTVTMEGTYDWEEIDTRAEYAFGPGTPNEFRFIANQTTRYIGNCN